MRSVHRIIFLLWAAPVLAAEPSKSGLPDSAVAVIEDAANADEKAECLAQARLLHALAEKENPRLCYSIELFYNTIKSCDDARSVQNAMKEVRRLWATWKKDRRLTPDADSSGGGKEWDPQPRIIVSDTFRGTPAAEDERGSNGPSTAQAARPPTQVELETALVESEGRIGGHDEYIRWLRNKGASPDDIRDAIWIRDAEQNRHHQLRQMLQSGRYQGGSRGGAGAWDQSFRAGTYRESARSDISLAWDRAWQNGRTQEESWSMPEWEQRITERLRRETRRTQDQSDAIRRQQEQERLAHWQQDCQNLTRIFQAVNNALLNYQQIQNQQRSVHAPVTPTSAAADDGAADARRQIEEQTRPVGDALRKFKQETGH